MPSDTEIDAALRAAHERLADPALASAISELLPVPRAGDLPDGPLHGVPVVVKELFDVGGSPRRSNTDVDLGVAAQDAAAVARLREAGAAVLARSVTHEFAWGITNRKADGSGTDNPAAPGRISGGSSGGSAAAVAAGAVPLALGSDTAGSIRIPPAFCGVIGWKPAYNAVPMDGCIPLAPSLDTGGFIGASLEWIRAALDAFDLLPAPSTQMEADSSLAGGHIRLGVLDAEAWALHDPAREAALATAVARLGGTVDTVAVPHPGDVLACFAGTQPREVLRTHRDLLRTWPSQADRYPPSVAGRLAAAEQLHDGDEGDALALRADVTERIERALDVVDVLVTVFPVGPPPADDPDRVLLPNGPRPLRDALLPWTVLANVTGAPAVVVPAGRDADNLPIAVQLIALPGREATLLAAAGRLLGE